MAFKWTNLNNSFPSLQSLTVARCDRNISQLRQNFQILIFLLESTLKLRISNILESFVRKVWIYFFFLRTKKQSINITYGRKSHWKQPKNSLREYILITKNKRATFIANAVMYYREKYSAPSFLIRCNNYVWCLKRFKTELEQILLDKTKKQKLRDLNIHFPDKGKIWRYVEDFALISRCNHTVILR